MSIAARIIKKMKIIIIVLISLLIITNLLWFNYFNILNVKEGGKIQTYGQENFN